MLRFKKIIRQIQIKRNRLKSKFDIVSREHRLHIRIQNKHAKTIRYILRILTLLGIISSVFTFNLWYVALLFSFGLVLVEQMLEEIIYVNNALIVQPLPKSWDGSCWTSIVLFADASSDLHLGLGFTNKKIALDFWETLLAWNDSKTINENIEIIFVLESKNSYSVYLSPSCERDFVKNSYERFQRDFDKKKNAGKELDVYVEQICFYKVFPFSKDCTYSLLKKHYGEVSLCIVDDAKIATRTTEDLYFDQREILCHSIKVVSRNELSPQDDTVAYYLIP